MPMGVFGIPVHWNDTMSHMRMWFDTRDYFYAYPEPLFLKTYVFFAFLRTFAFVLLVVAFFRLPRIINQPGKVNSDAPGWYPDPANPSRNRYWDGNAWQDAAPSPTATAPTTYQQPYAQANMSTPSTFAIVSLITAFFMPILAVIFGHLAIGEIRRSKGMKTGSGMATAGLILGYLGIAGIVLWIILIVNAASQTQY